MKLSLHCPSCSRPIAHFRPTTFAVRCNACGNEYGVAHGKLSQRSSVYETLLFLNKNLPRFYKRHYTLQITTADRTLKQLQFSMPGKLDEVPVHSGDMVSVLYTLRGYVMRNLVAITNHTTGSQLVFPKPIASHLHLGGIVGTVVLSLVVASYFSGVSLFLTAPASAIGVLMYLKMANTAQLTSPNLEAQGRTGDRLLADQKLLLQKCKIQHRMEELDHDSRSNQVLIQQLHDLKQKMADLDEYLYSARIYRTTSATKILQQQIENNQRLIREYGRTVKMIDVEIETSWIADQLPEADDFTRKILERLEELRTIEDQNQSLKFQLAAYNDIARS